MWLRWPEEGFGHAYDPGSTISEARRRVLRPPAAETSRRRAGRGIFVNRMRAALKLFAVLLKADRPLAVAWWIVVVLRGLLPALFAVATGALVGAVQRGQPLGGT